MVFLLFKLCKIEIVENMKVNRQIQCVTIIKKKFIPLYSFILYRKVSSLNTADCEDTEINSLIEEWSLFIKQ